MASNGSAKGTPSSGSSRDRSNQDRNKPKDATNPDSSLLKYFAEHPPVEEEVDIDFALNDQCLDERDGNHLAPNHYPVMVAYMNLSIFVAFLPVYIRIFLNKYFDHFRNKIHQLAKPYF